MLIAETLNEGEHYSVCARGLFHLLKNPICRGKFVHKGQVRDGEHEPIVEEDCPSSEHSAQIAA